MEVEEYCYLKAGKLLRPFSASARVKGKSYSMALERAITDLGAGLPFKAAVEKIREHYRIEIPESTARLIVEKHAKKVGRAERKERAEREEKFIISESDGSLIPIVEIPDGKLHSREDLRKKRTVCWKEVKL